MEEKLKRLRAAANSVAKWRNAQMWSDDLVQECMLTILEGIPLRLDRTGLSWFMHGLLDKWMRTRRSLSTVIAVALEMTRAETLPCDFVELKEIWELATPAEKKALFILMTEGSYRKDGASKRERFRDSTALYNLRQKLKE
jgi:hypothetical protein